MKMIKSKIVFLALVGLTSINAYAWRCCKPLSQGGGNCPTTHLTKSGCTGHNSGIVKESGACDVPGGTSGSGGVGTKNCACRLQPDTHNINGGVKYLPSGFNMSNSRYYATANYNIPLLASCSSKCYTMFGANGGTQDAGAIAAKLAASNNAKADGACGGWFSGPLKADGIYTSSMGSMWSYGIGGTYQEIDGDFSWKKHCNGTGYIYSQGTYTVSCQLKLRNEVLNTVVITSGLPASCKTKIPLANVESTYANKLKFGSNLFELHYVSTKPGKTQLVESKNYVKEKVISTGSGPVDLAPTNLVK